MSLKYVIIILALAIAVLSLIRDKCFKENFPNLLFWILIVLLVISAITEISISQKESKEKRYASPTGAISKRLKSRNIIYPSIKLGTAELVNQGPNGEPIFRIGNDPIKVWIENNELKVSTVIRNKDGKIIARLEANEWQVNPNLIFDKNFDKEAIEIINENGEVILQIELDGKSARFAGVFCLEDGWKVAFGNNVIEKRPPGEKIQTSFKPIFKYPSNSHCGERLKRE